MPSSPSSAYVAALKGDTLFLLGDELVRFGRDAATQRWQERQVLAVQPAASGGRDIAWDDQRIAVGRGSNVHVYRESVGGGDWSEVDVVATPGYAASVALDGDVLAVGNPGESDGSWPSVGAAYVFREEPQTGAFRLQQRIPWVGGGLTFGTNFGISIGLAGEFLAVSASCPVSVVGEVRMYRSNPTTGLYEPHSTLVPSAPWQWCEFGHDIVMDEGWLIVANHGAVHVFRHDAAGDRWDETDVVSRPDRGYRFGFGDGLAFDGERLLVTAPDHWGMTYELDQASGTLEFSGVLIPPATTLGGPISTPAIDGANAVLPRGSGAAASVFGDSICTSLGTRYCPPGEPNTMDMHARLDASGSDVVAEGRLLLRLMLAPADELCLFIAAPRGAAISPLTGRSGRLCVGSPTLRLGPRVVTRTSAAGFATLPCDLDRPSEHSPASILPGETWCFQAWYSDGGVGCFSDALAITFR